jgi:hypothetical protein
MQRDAGWMRLDAEDAAGVADLCAQIDRGALDPHVTLFHDPRWLAALADGTDRSSRVYALRRGGALSGLATFLVHRSALPLALGEWTFFSRPVRRLNALAAPVMRDEADAVDLLACIGSGGERGDVLFVESVAEGSAMFGLLARPRAAVGGFHAIRNGMLYQHRFATIPDSFDAYLRGLGAKTRADLRATRKRFAAHVGGEWRVRCFRSQADVPAFVADATGVSRKTYQYRLLGSGLREGEDLERCYRATAALGWFRSYVLYAHGAPIAFQVGHVYRGRFHAQEIGYDPQWADHHVGIFLHTEVVSDLAASGAAREFDFGNGDNLHKQRLATHARLEGYYYLIPATLGGSSMAHAMRATHAVSAALGAALARIGVRRKARDALRRLGVVK